MGTNLGLRFGGYGPDGRARGQRDVGKGAGRDGLIGNYLRGRRWRHGRVRGRQADDGGRRNDGAGRYGSAGSRHRLARRARTVARAGHLTINFGSERHCGNN